MSKSYRVPVTWLTIAALMSTAAMRGTAADASDSGGCRQQDGGTCFCNNQQRTTFDSSLCTENTASLDLSSNNLTMLHAYMFSRFVNVKVITLNHNSIHTIDKNAFGGLMGLEEIDLTNNKLRYLYPDLIAGNPNLNKIHLKNNFIVIPACGPLLRSTSLRVLHLDWCGINTLVEVEVFSELPNLRVLTLSGNDLHFVNSTPFLPLITSRTEIIKSDSKKCSAKFQETVLQLKNQINFTNQCNLSSIPVSMESFSFTTVQPNTTTERPPFPIDISLINFAITVIACVSVVVLVMFMCYVYWSMYCERKAPTLQEKLAARVCPPTTPIRDPFNDGYEPPNPPTVENTILDLPTAPEPYLALLSDTSPRQNLDSTDEEDLFRNFRQRGDSSTPLLEYERYTPERRPPQHVNVDIDVFNSNGGYRVSRTMGDLDGTKESKEHVNTLRVHKKADKEKEQSQSCDSNNPLQSTPIDYIESPKRPKKDVNNLDRPLPVTPVKLPLPTRRVR